MPTLKMRKILMLGMDSEQRIGILNLPIQMTNLFHLNGKGKDQKAYLDLHLQEGVLFLLKGYHTLREDLLLLVVSVL